MNLNEIVSRVNARIDRAYAEVKRDWLGCFEDSDLHALLPEVIINGASYKLHEGVEVLRGSILRVNLENRYGIDIPSSRIDSSNVRIDNHRITFDFSCEQPCGMVPSGKVVRGGEISFIIA